MRAERLRPECAASNANAASSGAVPISRGHRGGRALIDVRHPHVERHGAELEADACDDEHQTEHEQRLVRLRCRHASSDLGDLQGWGASGPPVAPYTMDMPYSSMPEASAPSTKYFMAASVAVAESRDSATMRVQAQAHQLEPEVQRQEVAGRDHDHHAQRRKQLSTKNSPRNMPRAPARTARAVDQHRGHRDADEQL